MKLSAESLRLYAVTDRTWLNGRTLAECVKESIAGGATMIQIREKSLGYEEFKSQALEIQAVCTENHIPFIVNDNVSLAREISADGVHVGQEDMNAVNVRKLIGAGKILGVSVRTADEADYLGAGAVFHTGTKLDAADVSHETLREICESVKIPVVAIGGISAGNIHLLAGSGIEGVAVISAIFAQDDIRGATRELLRLSEKYFAHDA